MIASSRPLRFALLTSSSPASVEAILSDPNRGVVYELVAIVAPNAFLPNRDAIAAAGIPILEPPTKDDEMLLQVIEPLGVDYLILDGFHSTIGELLLHALPQRIIALHDGDLAARDDEGCRIYSGVHAVREALISGEDETRASAFIVTRDRIDAPLLLLSGPYPVAQIARDARDWGAAGLLLAYADLHAEWMRRHAYGRMMRRIVELLAAGTVQIAGNIVWIDGAPGPCRLGEAPAMCHDGRTIDSGIPATCPFIAS